MRSGSVGSIREYVALSLQDAEQFLATFAGQEDAPAMRGYAEFGVPWFEGATGSADGFSDIANYRTFVPDSGGAGWMDNTTLVTASTLMSPSGPDAITPLTIWDLATFARSIVCYDRIYHHVHSDVDDQAINRLLGAEVLQAVPLPIAEVPAGRVLPAEWMGAHHFMCDVWMRSKAWLRRLSSSVEKETLDGQQIRAVTTAWRAALGREDLEPGHIVDWENVDHRWTSPSNRLLVETANITGVDDTRMYLDPTENFRAVAKFRADHGLPDENAERRAAILSDLNVRSYVNQCIANFFDLPYACSLGRLPFRQHLYDRSVAVQQELTTARVMDDRYGEMAKGVRLRLPVFLAVALRDAPDPAGLWPGLARLRANSADFRHERVSMDQSLARGDLKEARKVARALTLSVDGLLAVAGDAVASATSVVLEKVAKGDLDTLGYGIAATKAASGPVLKSSFRQRLIWRLRQPQLLWMNSVIDQSEHLTESMPDFARIWSIPQNEQGVFAERFQRMTILGGAK